MSTGPNDPNKCRWCGMFHGPNCPIVKAVEFFEDGTTIKRVEFKTAADYPQLATHIPTVWPGGSPPNGPAMSQGFAGLPEQYQASSGRR